MQHLFCLLRLSLAPTLAAHARVYVKYALPLPAPLRLLLSCLFISKRWLLTDHHHQHRRNAIKCKKGRQKSRSEREREKLSPLWPNKAPPIDLPIPTHWQSDAAFLFYLLSVLNIRRSVANFWSRFFFSFISLWQLKINTRREFFWKSICPSGAVWVVKNGVQNFLFIWSESICGVKWMNMGEGECHRALTDGCTGASFLPWQCVFICRRVNSAVGLSSDNVLVILLCSSFFIYRCQRPHWVDGEFYMMKQLSHLENCENKFNQLQFTLYCLQKN